MESTTRTISESTGREPSIYGHRFSPLEQQRRELVWKLLCRDFFQQLVPANGTVIDLGAGDGNFIRHIQCARRIAVDVSPHVLPLRDFGIEVVQVSATSFAAGLEGQADVVFLSNFLEHLPHKNLVLEVLEQCYRVLKRGGKVMILQPNIRHLGAAYWDYIDHHIALTDVALEEGLEVIGFRVTRVISKFLPYTAKSWLSMFASLTALYIRVPILWKIFGKQSLIIAEKP